jgi:hypothetical protein
MSEFEADKRMGWRQRTFGLLTTFFPLGARWVSNMSTNPRVSF